MKLVRILASQSCRVVLAAAWTSLAAAGSPSQPPPQQKTHARAAAPASSSSAQPKYKGIWEPVNYKADLLLDDVFFVTQDEGWVAGGHATILHTTDGGQSWTAQLGGDPQSADPGIKMLRFLDQRHGWAIQDTKLLGTADGEHWEAVGTMAPNMVDYQFISSMDGVALYGAGGTAPAYQIYRTRDGGRTWKDVATCKIGMPGADCWFTRLQFSSSRTGYAVGGYGACVYGCGGPPVIAKTEDGGESWRIFLGPGDLKLSRLDAVFFVDEHTGFVRATQDQDRKFYATSDGGGTWRGLLASPGPNLRFADPEVGWAFDGARLTFTTDGGQHWSSRDTHFPASPRGFSLPRRDRGYVVGEHGMVYRYRVVALDYTAKGMIDAPLMPPYGGALLGHLQDMKTQVAALQGKLGAAAKKEASSSGQLLRAVYRGGQNAEASATFTDGTPLLSQNAPAMGGFVQDTSDIPPSPFVQNCCAPQVRSLQTSFGSFSQEVPSFGSRFRSLNLIMAGLNLASDLLGKTKQMRDSFVALKQATDRQTANAALQGLFATLDNTQRAISMGFANFSAASLAAGAPETLQNAAAVFSAPNAPQAAPITQPAIQSADQAKKVAQDAAEALRKKLEKLPF